MATYNPITNMFTFAYITLCFLNIQPTSTMNKVLGFESGNIQSTIVPTTLVTANGFANSTVSDLNKYFNFKYNGTTYPVTYAVGKCGYNGNIVEYFIL